jgi:hypothetical protein
MVISWQWSQPYKKWSKYKAQFNSNTSRFLVFLNNILSPALVTQYGMIFYICNYVHITKYATGNSTSFKVLAHNLPAGKTMNTFHQNSLYLSWDLMNITDEWQVHVLWTWEVLSLHLHPEFSNPDIFAVSLSISRKTMGW